MPDGNNCSAFKLNEDQKPTGFDIACATTPASSNLYSLAGKLLKDVDAEPSWENVQKVEDAFDIAGEERAVQGLTRLYSQVPESEFKVALGHFLTGQRGSIGKLAATAGFSKTTVWRRLAAIKKAWSGTD